MRSVRLIDRRTELGTLRACGLAASLLPVPSGNLPAKVRCDTSSPEGTDAEARIRFVRLTPGQVSSMFEAMRRRYPDVRKLYANFEGKGFGLVEKQVRGAVIRAYSAGVVRREGIVVELSHERADGTEASFNVSIEDRVADDGEGGSVRVRADYEIRRGGQVAVYEIKDGRPRLMKVATTLDRKGVDRVG